jgi:hypothetical protein
MHSLPKGARQFTNGTVTSKEAKGWAPESIQWLKISNRALGINVERMQKRNLLRLNNHCLLLRYETTFSDVARPDRIAPLLDAISK